jgi:hypothetical protein
MSWKTVLSTGLVMGFVGACYFAVTFVLNCIELEKYASVTGSVRIFLAMATGLNVFNLLFGFVFLCFGGMSFYLLKTYKA